MSLNLPGTFPAQLEDTLRSSEAQAQALQHSLQAAQAEAASKAELARAETESARALARSAEAARAEAARLSAEANVRLERATALSETVERREKILQAE